jgi:hypothetical protein
MNNFMEVFLMYYLHSAQISVARMTYGLLL